MPGGVRSGADRSAGRRIVAALAATQTVGYGVLYYAFAVLLLPMAASLRVSSTAVTGAFTVSVLSAAVAAIPVGRWQDRHGARGLMSVGSLAATALVVAWSQVTSVGQLYAVQAGIGVTGAMVLYPPATALVVAWFEPARRPRAILVVIGVAGFASTIFFPLTGVLLDAYDWRTSLLVLAAVHAVVTVPLHALVLRDPPSRPAPAPLTGPAEPTGTAVPAGPDGADRRRRARVRAAVRDPRFWVLTVTFLAHEAAMSAMTVHLVGFLVSRGHPVTFAATAGGLLGVLSVTGRLALTAGQRRVPLTTLVAAVFALQALAAVSLPVLGGTAIGAVVAVTCFGVGFGVASLATPPLLADRYGTEGYATISGIHATPVTVAKAVAPVAAAALLHASGYPVVLAVIAGCCAVAAVGIGLGARRPGPAPSPAVAPAAGDEPALRSVSSGAHR